MPEGLLRRAGSSTELIPTIMDKSQGKSLLVFSKPLTPTMMDSSQGKSMLRLSALQQRMGRHRPRTAQLAAMSTHLILCTVETVG